MEIPIHPDFINKKVDIEPQKVDIQELKVNYMERLKILGVNNSTLDKVNILLDIVELGQIFGRADIVNALDISPTAVSNFIRKMCQADVFETVEEKGKGSYRLRIY